MTMELTQRLECTQELYTNNCAKTYPDQIGFLGICGSTYPLHKGPNKIGRDPSTCNIVLDLNSISRQHAVINILNSHDFMLMDLDSANKTKLADKILLPYIPHPLKNGDMVQFGQVFGVFRLLEEENDLPMTQAIDIPETPVHNRHVSKLNNCYATTIPESPDISDKDDSFIATTQQKPNNLFKSPNSNFLKSSGKTIAIKPVGTKKIDNVYWSSSKKSDSFTTQSNVSNNFDDSFIPPQINDKNSTKQNIHELDTQAPYEQQNEINDSIYEANTQVLENLPSPNIYEMETQVPTLEKLPDICKIQGQEDLHFNFSADNKENDNNIFNAETQISFDVNTLSPKEKVKTIILQNEVSTSKEGHNISDDIILFDEIDSQPLQDNFESQPLLSPTLPNSHSGCKSNNTESGESCLNPERRVNRIKSDSSTDCEDINIAVTQKIVNDDDSTDCEDETDFVLNSNNKQRQSPDIDDNVTDCEDDLNEKESVLSNIQVCNNFEDLPTQVLVDAHVATTINEKTNTANKEITSNFEQAPTQIIEKAKCQSKPETVTKMLSTEPDKHNCFAEALTQQIYSEEVVKFKVPFQSPIRKKRKNDTTLNVSKDSANTVIVDDDDHKYYAATQELFNDLCSQKSLSPKVSSVSDEIFIKNRLSDTKHYQLEPTDTNCDVEKRINEFVSNLSCSQICDVVGVQKSATVLKIMSSDSSDTEATPIKINPSDMLKTILPNTQEIIDSISPIRNTSDTESSNSENLSESDNDSRQISLVIGKQKIKRMNKIKINLSDRFDPETLPTRTSSRVRKPTSKLQNCDEFSENICEDILKPRAIREQKNKPNKPDLNEYSFKNKKPAKKLDELDTNRNAAKDPHSLKKNIAKKLDEDKPEKSDLSKCKNAKQKSESNDKRKQTKINEYVTGVPNETRDSVSSNRNTRSRHNKKDESSSGHKKSKSPEKSKAKSERNSNDNKITRKRTRVKSRSPKRDESKHEIKDKRSKSTKEIVTTDTTETEIRRSKRNKTTKKSEESLRDVPKSKSNSNYHEQSTVYSIINSSDSGTESPNKLKRLSTNELEMPIAKKAKIAANTNNPITRATPARKIRNHRVLFTAFPCEEVKDKLERLGAVIVSDVMTCTVVLTLQLKRTFKLLCAVGLGKPIVGPNWVQACVDTNMIVDPWLYLIKDEATENRFKFNLHLSLAGKRDFLKGYNVSSTPSVMPSGQEMKLIVESSGGTWREGGSNWICVSASADKSLWAGLKRRGATVVSTEFILGGVLRQKLDIERNKLA